ncbi:hypothetical protein [Flavihumibacter petaseus]|uniref:hypothetical protein n=1 Tax=Flavihumibacter petaseus TaxID=549295 RepID=UPI00061CDED9|nr:hypothetical protein [Flavihumibacter petaseus]
MKTLLLFQSVTKTYKYPLTRSTEISNMLDEIITTRYSSSKFSLWGEKQAIPGHWQFYTKRYGFPTSLSAKGGKLSVTAEIGDHHFLLKATAGVNLSFLILFYIGAAGLILTSLGIGLPRSILTLLFWCGFLAAVFLLDKLNKKILLALLERYIPPTRPITK